jgi:hypothetical protein
MKKKIRSSPPKQIVERVARRAQFLKDSGAQRVLVVYDEESVRMYGEHPTPTPPRKTE